MQILPVLDLLGGRVVAAKRGGRDRYRPIETPLAQGSAPADVAAGLLRLYPFEAIYAADLDAIEGRGGNLAAIADLAARFPNQRFWIDAGVRGAEAARALLAAPWADVVLGSESLETAAPLRALAGESRVALSLDFRGEDFLGPPEILDDESLWPQRIIVMTLARVGAGEGPDFERLREIIARGGARRVFAAGGVRGGGDLAMLRAMGAAGVLVSTALHRGRLGPADLAGQ